MVAQLKALKARTWLVRCAHLLDELIYLAFTKISKVRFAIALVATRWRLRHGCTELKEVDFDEHF